MARFAQAIKQKHMALHVRGRSALLVHNIFCYPFACSPCAASSEYQSRRKCSERRGRRYDQNLSGFLMWTFAQGKLFCRCMAMMFCHVCISLSATAVLLMLY